MAEYFMKPSLVLETEQDMRIAVLINSLADWKKNSHPFQYRVRSNTLVNLIDEIVKSSRDGFAYNSQVRQIAIDRFDLPQEDVNVDGTTLSVLIYNAQGFRRDDNYIAQGYEPFTPELIERAGLGGQIETPGGILNVREVNGRLYAMPPRKRIYAAQPTGTPAKIIKFSKRKIAHAMV